MKDIAKLKIKSNRGINDFLYLAGINNKFNISINYYLNQAFA